MINTPLFFKVKLFEQSTCFKSNFTNFKPIRLQDKNVRILQESDRRIVADSGYDGLGEVNVVEIAINKSLYPPTLVNQIGKLIINDTNNGAFASGYDVYSNGQLIDTISEKEYDLISMPIGEHEIYVVAKGEGFTDSKNSNSIFNRVYSMTTNLNGISCDFFNKVCLYQTVSGYLIPDSGCYLPREISVLVEGEPAEYIYNCYTGEIVISNVTGDVCIQAYSNPFPILLPPSLSVDYNIVKWDEIENATSYKVYSYGEFLCETQDLKVDLKKYLQSGKSYEISVTAVGENFQESACSEGLIIEIENFAPVYGVSGLYDDTTTKLNRTYDAVSFNYYFNSSSGEIVSDFDNVFPYNEMDVVEKNGNIMVKVPTMYFQIETNPNNILTSIAVSKEPRDDGDWYKSQEFYIGAYLNGVDGDKLVSKTQLKINTLYSLANTKSYMLNNGEGFKCMFLNHYVVIYFLALIEFATKDMSQFIIKDSSNFTGSTDDLTTNSGLNVTTGTFKYRNIEDFFGGEKIFIFNIMFFSNYVQVYDEKNKKLVPMGEEYIKTSNTWINGYKWIKDFPFNILPCDFTTQNINSYSGKATLNMGGNTRLVLGGRYSRNLGVNGWDAYYDDNISNNTATRIVWEELNDN